MCPIVSICMTTYNHERFVSQAIDSILAQKVNKEVEILIGEDQSSDNTRAIVREYENRYRNVIRVFYHSYPHNYKRINGRSNFINNLLHANGEYIALLDGDDYWSDPYKLQKQIDFLDNNPHCIAVFHWVDCLEGDYVYDKAYGPHTLKAYYTVDDLLEHSNFIPTCSVVFRRQATCIFPQWFYDSPYADLPLHIMNAMFGKIGFIDESMGVYRIHPGGRYTSMVEIDKQINNLYAFELIATNLGLLDNKFYQSYVESRMGSICELALDETYRLSGLKLLSGILERSTSVNLPLVNNMYDQLCYYHNSKTSKNRVINAFRRILMTKSEAVANLLKLIRRAKYRL